MSSHFISSVVIAAIPSPGFSGFTIGPLQIRMYGLLIGLGVIAGVWLAGKMFERHHIGDPDDVSAIAVWGVAAGVIGARLYHVVTDFQQFRGNYGAIFKIWEGGLGIPGGLLFGVIAGLIVGHRRGIPLMAGLSCAAPGIALAQSIGRLGNYFNQELYGRPTTLPWGLQIDAAHLAGTPYPVGTLFHPTVFYESLWSLGLCLLLVWIDRRFNPAPGRLFAMYLLGYGTGRLWIESLRVDPANRIFGQRINIWMALSLIITGAVWLWVTRNSTATWPTQASDSDSDADTDSDSDSDTDSDNHDDGEADTGVARSASVATSTTRTRSGKGSRRFGVDADDDTGPSTRGPDTAEPASTSATSGKPAPRSRTHKTVESARVAGRSGSAQTPQPKRDETDRRDETGQSEAKPRARRKAPAREHSADRPAPKRPATSQSATGQSATSQPAASQSATGQSGVGKSIDGSPGKSEGKSTPRPAASKPSKPAENKPGAPRANDEPSDDEGTTKR